MAQQIINVGSAPNDGTGDVLRNSQIKANANFTELYNDVDLKLDKVTSSGVERAYIINADGSQSTKATSDFKDVLEFANLAAFPVTGETSKIYLALDANSTYRWSGSAYVQIGGGSQNLQQVTDVGNYTSNNIQIDYGNASTIQFVDGKDNILQNISGNSNIFNIIDVPNSKSFSLIFNDDSDLEAVGNGIIATREWTNANKVDKDTTAGVERAYIINSDGTQSTKPTSDFGTVKGTGTINRISKFTASGTIGDSQIFDDGTKVGIGTTSPQARLDVRAQGALETNTVFRVRNSTDTKNFLVVNGAGDVYNNGASGITSNTFFGEYVGRNTTGLGNTAFGRSALLLNTTGNYNTANGVSALQSNTTGTSNTAIGVSALLNNTTGNYNTAIGNNALQSNTTGTSNTAIGVSALQNNTTGNYNAANGVSALQNNTTGNYNAAIGVSAGRYISDGSNQTITNNSIFIGTDTRALADNQTNQIVIGYNAIGLGSNSVVLGNTSITRTQLRGQVIMGAFASAPTGIEGAIYYDSTKKKHYGFDGITWNVLY